MKIRLNAVPLEQREVPALFGFLIDQNPTPPPTNSPPASTSPSDELFELDGIAFVDAADAAAATQFANTALATFTASGNTGTTTTVGSTPNAGGTTPGSTATNNLLTPGGPAYWISPAVPIELPPIPDGNLGDAGTGLQPYFPPGPSITYFPMPGGGSSGIKLPKPKPGDDPIKIDPIFNTVPGGGKVDLGVKITQQVEDLTLAGNGTVLVAPRYKDDGSLKFKGTIEYKIDPRWTIKIDGMYFWNTGGRDKWEYNFGVFWKY